MAGWILSTLVTVVMVPVHSQGEAADLSIDIKTMFGVTVAGINKAIDFARYLIFKLT